MNVGSCDVCAICTFYGKVKVVLWIESALSCDRPL